MLKLLKTAIIVLLFITPLKSEIKVVTTTTVIYDIVKQVGGDLITADYICRGDQDPHFLEVLPSYMLKIRKADLMFENGLGLELWAQKLIDGSRNADLKLIDLSANIPKKQVPTRKIDASQGDIHPYGNPHYWLDPENVKIMAGEILNQLSIHDPDNQTKFSKNYERFIGTLDKKQQEWNDALAGVAKRQLFVYHDSWVYFADRFGFRIAGFIEHKPGVPPTPAHNAELIRLASGSTIGLILMENYYSDSSPKQIAEAAGIRIAKVPIYVYGVEGVPSYITMMDYIVAELLGNG